MPLISISNA
jgi:glycosyltransferase involved in cell wall biosynthesis